MPLTNTIKNQIAAQLDTIFDAIAAGTAFTNPESLTLSTTFTAGGRTFRLKVSPDGESGYARIIVLLKRMPL